VRLLGAVPGRQIHASREAVLGMATLYTLGSGQPYPYLLGLNFTGRITRIHTRIEKYFHTRARRIICTRHNPYPKITYKY